MGVNALCDMKFIQFGRDFLTLVGAIAQGLLDCPALTSLWTMLSLQSSALCREIWGEVFFIFFFIIRTISY